MANNTKVYLVQGGDEQVVDSGGTVTVNDGGAVNMAGTMTVTGVFILPTSDPGVAGAVWNNSGTLTVSSGS